MKEFKLAFGRGVQSVMLPGLTGVVTACIAGFIIAHVLY